MGCFVQPFNFVWLYAGRQVGEIGKAVDGNRGRHRDTVAWVQTGIVAASQVAARLFGRSRHIIWVNAGVSAASRRHVREYVVVYATIESGKDNGAWYRSDSRYG